MCKIILYYRYIITKLVYELNDGGLTV